MVFNYTDKQLNELNHGKNVYSVNAEYAERNNRPLVTETPNPNPSSSDFEETNTITTSDGQEFRVVVTKFDLGTGFDVLAVAPMVNGEPNYKNVAVIAAGTDQESPTKTDRCKTTFSYYSVI